MEYCIYKLEFTTAVHFGNRTLEDREFFFGADRLFSALCQECVKEGEEKLDLFYQKVKKGDILLSDGLPYDEKSYYIPKPLKRLSVPEAEEGDSRKKKAYKKLKYIPAEKLRAYLNGELDAEREREIQKSWGTGVLKTSAAIRGQEETKPYHVGLFHFQKGCGLYVIMGYQREEDLELMQELFEKLSYTGLGGKRSSGLGKFQCILKRIPEELKNGLTGQGETYMTLSVALPRDDELEKALEQASYLVVKRSGFVDSDHYAEAQMRKKNLYVLQAGSCFSNRFTGDIYDVSDGGRHAVYRYAKPFFLEVSR